MVIIMYDLCCFVSLQVIIVQYILVYKCVSWCITNACSSNPQLLSSKQT